MSETTEAKAAKGKCRRFAIGVASVPTIRHAMSDGRAQARPIGLVYTPLLAERSGGPLHRFGQSVAAYADSDNHLIDLKHAVIMAVEATTAIRQAEVGAAKTMLDRTAEQFDITPVAPGRRWGIRLGRDGRVAGGRASPKKGEHNGTDDEHLAPENLGRVHGNEGSAAARFKDAMHNLGTA
jgi:hypothetical protein